MSTLTLDENHATYQIQSYRPGFIQINQQTFHHSLILTPKQLFENWQPKDATALTQSSFSIILDLKPSILLIGTGEKHILLPIELYGNLFNLGIGVEVMNTSAASRTYNALSAEDRNVAAALIV